VIFWIALISNPKNQAKLELKDYLIVHFVTLTIPLILQYKTTLFDKNSQSVTFTKKNLIMNKTISFKFSDINRVEMVYGKGGNYARSGVIQLTVKNKQIQIVDSDLNKNRTRKNQELCEKIKDWIKEDLV